VPIVARGNKPRHNVVAGRAILRRLLLLPADAQPDISRRQPPNKYSPRELRPLSEDSARQVPPPGIHPLVRTHPENGRKALYLNPVRIEGIIGIEDEQALDLVAELMTHATQKKYEYRHQWRYGDFVIWDNRSVIHKANPDYDMNERRYLYRLMLKGETPV
jgi:taurine dioxygenase